jgi:hypothetical protein
VGDAPSEGLVKAKPGAPQQDRETALVLARPVAGGGGLGGRHTVAISDSAWEGPAQVDETGGKALIDTHVYELDLRAALACAIL